MREKPLKIGELDQLFMYKPNYLYKNLFFYKNTQVEVLCIYEVKNSFEIEIITALPQTRKHENKLL